MPVDSLLAVPGARRSKAARSCGGKKGALSSTIRRPGTCLGKSMLTVSYGATYVTKAFVCISGRVSKGSRAGLQGDAKLLLSNP